MNTPSRPRAERLIKKLARELNRQYPKAARCLREDVARVTVYYDFPKGALEAPAYNQHHRVELRPGPLTDERLQAAG